MSSDDEDLYDTAREELDDEITMDFSSLGPADICELIQGSDEASTSIRKQYLSRFSFNPPLISSLRQFLGTIVLSGETQEQDRILSAFAIRYVETSNDGLPLGAVYPLVYSIILLNTDLHNQQNDNPMTKDQYVNNTLHTVSLAYEGDGNPPISKQQTVEMLESIYGQVKLHPIVHPRSNSIISPSKKNFTLSRRVTEFFLLKRQSSRFSSAEETNGAETTSDKVPSMESTFIRPPKAPFKSGVLFRKHVLHSNSKRAADRRWLDCYCEIIGSDFIIYENYQKSNFAKYGDLSPKKLLVSDNDDELQVSRAKTVEQKKYKFHIPLRHAIAVVLPDGCYSLTRKFVFQIILLNGGLWLFQCASRDIACQWADCINYWAALESREPLTDGVGSWYGIESEWLLDFLPSDENFPRNFGELNAESISSYKPPSLPQVPDSMSQGLAKVSLVDKSNQNSSKLSTPSGYDGKNLGNSSEKYRCWEKSFHKHCGIISELIYSREILRCFGIGRGVIDVTAYDVPLTVEGEFFDGNASSHSVVLPHDLSWNGNKSLIYSSIPAGWVISEDKQVTYRFQSLLDLPGDADQFSLSGGVPKTLIEREKGSAPEGISIAVLPPPLNLIIRLKRPPSQILDNLLSSEASSKPFSGVPNFKFQNKKLASKINQNWWSKYRFHCYEAIKSFKYRESLKNGVSISTKNAGSSPSIDISKEPVLSFQSASSTSSITGRTLGGSLRRKFTRGRKTSSIGSLRNSSYMISPPDTALFSPASTISSSKTSMGSVGGDIVSSAELFLNTKIWLEKVAGIDGTVLEENFVQDK